MKKTTPTVLWKSERLRSLEYCCVRRARSGWGFQGLVLIGSRRNPVAVGYRINTNEDLETLRVSVGRYEARREIRLNMHVRDGAWVVNGTSRRDLAGCKDVDLEFSPVTNTLPIRREPLRVGQSVDLVAAWVRLKTLNVAPLRQSYQRLGAREYRYRSATGFSARLQVDKFGLVRRYGRIWEMVR